MIALDDLIRDIVRAEVRAAVAEALAKPPAARNVTVAEFAAQHAVSPSTVRAAIKDGRLAAVRIGRAVRVPADAVIGRPMVASKRAESAAERARKILGGAR